LPEGQGGKISYLSEKGGGGDISSFTGFILDGVRAVDWVGFSSGGPSFISVSGRRPTPEHSEKKEKTGGVGNLRASLKNGGSLSFFR